jgi:hypothetical protein
MMAYAYKGKGVLSINGKLYGEDLQGIPEALIGGNEIPEDAITAEVAESLGDALVKAVKVKTAAADKKEKKGKVK